MRRGRESWSNYNRIIFEMFSHSPITVPDYYWMKRHEDTSRQEEVSKLVKYYVQQETCMGPNKEGRPLKTASFKHCCCFIERIYFLLFSTTLLAQWRPKYYISLTISLVWKRLKPSKFFVKIFYLVIKVTYELTWRRHFVLKWKKETDLSLRQQHHTHILQWFNITLTLCLKRIG